MTGSAASPTAPDGAIGFIGLGVMGEPMCRNLARKCGRPVVGHDLSAAPLGRLAADGVRAAGSLAEAARCDTVMLSLPGGAELESVCRGPGGLLAAARRGQTIVDLGTSPVALTRHLAEAFAARGADYADAPAARTRAAAAAGTLSVMVGAAPAVFERLRPLLACFASDITHCGGVGAGQVVKILNNMVLIENVVALAEAAAIGRRAGVDAATLLGALSKGSADSFALRNHGLKAIVPGDFPERAFPTTYALKDLSYALELAAAAGIAPRGADVAKDLLERAVARGDGGRYWPVIARVVDEAG